VLRQLLDRFHFLFTSHLVGCQIQNVGVCEPPLLRTLVGLDAFEVPEGRPSLRFPTCLLEIAVRGGGRGHAFSGIPYYLSDPFA
jgi:hypothetical protein